MPRAAGALAGACIVALIAAGCGEKLDGSAACPITCNDASAQIQTVSLDAVTNAVTVPGGLGLGTEQRMLLANRGDTLDTRVIIRFDSLPARSQTTSGDTTTKPISIVDSVYLKLHIDSSAAKANVPVTLSIYDVDTPSTNDTSVAVLQPLFVSSRLIYAQQFAAGTLTDSVSLRLPNSVILAKVQSGQKLRIGLQISGPSSVSMRIASSEVTIGPMLSFRTATDTAIKAISLVPYSTTPTANRSIAQSLGDFTIVVKGTPAATGDLLGVGGLPATRAYIRFNIPSRIVDSSLVIRATLVLTQKGSTSPNPTDTMFVRPFLVLAGTSVTDPVKAAQISADTTQARFEQLGTLPGASGTREFEIAPAFGFWAAQTDAQLPRAIDLQSTQEDYSPQQALFYSSNASDPTLRPKLRISYTIRSRIGIP